MKIKDLAVGDVFSIDVAPGVASVGVVHACSKASGKLMLISLSEPFAMEGIVLEKISQHLPSLPHLKIVGDVKVKNGEWPRIGKTTPSRQDNDPLPSFSVGSIAPGEVRNELFYSPSMALVGGHPRKKDDHRDLPDGSVHSPGSLLAFLQKRYESFGGALIDAEGIAINDVQKSASEIELLNEDQSRDYIEGAFGVSDTPWEILKQTFATVRQTEYVEVDLGFQAISAGSIIVALLRGKQLSVEVSENVGRAMAGISTDMARSLVADACKALAKVLSEDSELMDVWHSDADKLAFVRQVEGIAQDLSS